MAIPNSNTSFGHGFWVPWLRRYIVDEYVPSNKCNCRNYADLSALKNQCFSSGKFENSEKKFVKVKQ